MQRLLLLFVVKINKGIQINEGDFLSVEDIYTINEEENKITFAISKDIIGDPEIGDMLYDPSALGGVRFVSDSLSQLLMMIFGTNILAVDLTGEGMDYTIEI